MTDKNKGPQVGPSAGQRRFWSTSEIRYLRQHRSDGASEIAAALGRTSKAVRRAAAKHKISLKKAQPGELCPLCATYTISRNGNGWKHGMCQRCWNRHKAELRRQVAAESEAEALYQKEKKASQRRSS